MPLTVSFIETWILDSSVNIHHVWKMIDNTFYKSMNSALMAFQGKYA